MSSYRCSCLNGCVAKYYVKQSFKCGRCCPGNEKKKENEISYVMDSMSEEGWAIIHKTYEKTAFRDSINRVDNLEYKERKQIEDTNDEIMREFIGYIIALNKKALRAPSKEVVKGSGKLERMCNLDWRAVKLIYAFYPSIPCRLHVFFNIDRMDLHQKLMREWLRQSRNFNNFTFEKIVARAARHPENFRGEQSLRWHSDFWDVLVDVIIEKISREKPIIERIRQVEGTDKSLLNNMTANLGKNRNEILAAHNDASEETKSLHCWYHELSPQFIERVLAFSDRSILLKFYHKRIITKEEIVTVLKMTRETLSKLVFGGFIAEYYQGWSEFCK